MYSSPRPTFTCAGKECKVVLLVQTVTICFQRRSPIFKSALDFKHDHLFRANAKNCPQLALLKSSSAPTSPSTETESYKRGGEGAADPTRSRRTILLPLPSDLGVSARMHWARTYDKNVKLPARWEDGVMACSWGDEDVPCRA